MERNGERSSGLELMRILCMLLIVTGHYGVHGGYDVFTADNLSVGAVFVLALSMFGQASCSAFALISGFYMVERRRERHYRRIVPLAAEMVFYSLGIWLISLLGGRPLSLTDGLKAFFPFLWEYWYVSYYLIFFLLIPFINPFLLGMRKRTFLRLLVVVYILWSVIPTFTAKAWSFSHLDFFLVMYLTGAYIKLHVHGKASYDNRWNLAAALAAAAVTVLSVVGFAAAGYLLHSDFLVWNACYFRDYSKLPVVIFAVALFLYFSNVHFVSRTVNRIAGSMVGVYLIHDNYLAREYIWQSVWPNAGHLAAPYLHAAIKIPAVFLAGLGIDLVRRATVGKLFDGWFFRHCDGICAWVRARLPGPVRALLSDEPQERPGR